MEKPTLKPHQLEKGDTIGVIAPAGPVSETELQPGLAFLESFGFKVQIGPHVYHKQEYLAGDDEMRLADFHCMVEDPGVRAIICARGGYGTMRLLDGIDFDLIRNNPKIILGYSDITALLIAITKKTGLVTFHGPVVKDIAKNNEENFQSALNLMKADRDITWPLASHEAINPGIARGKLIGGNLSMINYMVGTPYLPTLKGALLFLEEKGEAPYRIDRMLTHLRLGKHFDELAGIILGEFRDCGERITIENLFKEVLSDYHFPIAGGLPVGHGTMNLAIPVGAEAVLDTESMTISLQESCVAQKTRP